MDVQQNNLVDSSQSMPVTQSTAGTRPDRKDKVHLMDAICARGERVCLRPQQRVQLPPAGKMAILSDGLLAIDAMPAKGKLQILDFLVAGDIVTASIVLRTPGVSLRAISSASLVSFDHRVIDLDPAACEYWASLSAQYQNQLARVNIHQLMIGRLETEPRVASFLLALALADISGQACGLNVTLPMSRTDIANYLVINSDTLSRTMMKFSDLGLIKRVSRHLIRILDIERLRKISPLAPLLSAVFEKGISQHGDWSGHSSIGAFISSGHSNHAVLCRSATTPVHCPV
ncbi:MAG TPA: Crp/Fnr family transcriptional regulator [Xanthobacteraceae bacterium]|nr:Crp/Fnr family transcriptional regulator [Xanthobacteraceae bacterium]